MSDAVPESGRPPEREVATLGGGCFWCLEAAFEQLRGVDGVVSGYTGGHLARPTYKDVCSGLTGHAEVVQITFDPQVISYDDLLNVFFTIHDPTTLNRQGPDSGTQYRSAVFYHSEAQKKAAEARIRDLNAQKLWDAPIVTEVVPLKEFHAAEDYHQGYYDANSKQPYCRAIVAPKVQKVRKLFLDKLRKP